MKNALTKNLDDPVLESMPVVPTDRLEPTDPGAALAQQGRRLDGGAEAERRRGDHSEGARRSRGDRVGRDAQAARPRRSRAQLRAVADRAPGAARRAGRPGAEGGRDHRSAARQAHAQHLSLDQESAPRTAVARSPTRRWPRSSSPRTSTRRSSPSCAPSPSPPPSPPRQPRNDRANPQIAGAPRAPRLRRVDRARDRAQAGGPHQGLCGQARGAGAGGQERSRVAPGRAALRAGPAEHAPELPRALSGGQRRGGVALPTPMRTSPSGSSRATRSRTRTVAPPASPRCGWDPGSTAT